MVGQFVGCVILIFFLKKKIALFTCSLEWAYSVVTP